MIVPLSIRRIPRRWSDSRSWVLFLLPLFAFCLLACSSPEKPDLFFQGVSWLGCPLKKLTGVACPFCGMTHGCAWMLRGDPARALQANILSPLAFLALTCISLYSLSFRLVAGLRIETIPGRRGRGIMLAGLIGLIVAAWCANL